jgi:hypothetical protein
MKQTQQKNVIPWPCSHPWFSQADSAYEVSQERGYNVTRHRGVEPVASLPAPSPVSSLPREIRGNVIPFPQRPTSNLGNSADIRTLIDSWLQLASAPTR